MKLHRTSVLVVLLAVTLSLGSGGSALATQTTSVVLAAGDPGSLLLLGGVFDPVLDGVAPARGEVEVVIVQLTGAPTRVDIERLQALGATVHHYLPNNAYLVELADGNPLPIRSMERVRWVGPYLPEYKLPSPLISAPPTELKAPVTLDVQLLPGANGVMTVRAARASSNVSFRVGGIFTQSHRTLVRVVVPFADAQTVAWAMASQPQVVSVQHRPEPQLLNDDSVWVVQSYDLTNGPTEANASVPRQYPQSATVWGHGLYGEDQIVAVADSGLSTMCFFEYADGGFPTPQDAVPPSTGTIDPAAKVIAYYTIPGAVAQDHSACSYHGTHVAGSVAGDNRANLVDPAGGQANQNVGDGMAPAAQLVMQDVGAASGFSCSLSGLSGDLTVMFEQAYAAGARIHTNSWGSETPTYTSDAQDMDEMMWRREDIVFTVAMGNSGTAQGDSSIGAPATAKNIISVGGVSNGGASSRADAMTTYSRGPTADGRLKPDVVTPASSIVSANGSTSCGTTSKSGTSMATPTTAGAVTLLREYFTRGFPRLGVASAADEMIPSGALMKAALTCGATPLGQVSGNDPLGGTVTDIPSNDQGWGRTYLEGALYFAGDDERVRYRDVRHRNGIETGETATFQVDVPAGSSQLRVALAWSDPPSATSAALNLVNDLDLEVESPGSRAVYLGNVFDQGVSVSGGSADRLNPIESVRLDAPDAGTWTVRVIGFNVPGTGIALNSERQGYALVVSTGECTGDVPATPTGLAAVDNGASGVALSWDPVTGAERYRVYVAPEGCGADASSYSFLGETTVNSFVDTRTYGGYTVAYRVVADNGCNDSARSECASATSTGPCTLEPAFAGLVAVSNPSSLAQCALQLDWSEGSSSCPAGATLQYNVYRSTDPLFNPTPAELVATTNNTTFVDQTVQTATTYYYVVRAEDSTSGGAGPNGGNEEDNLVRIKGTPWVGTDTTVADFFDDGGDSTAWLDGEFPWTVSNQENSTTGGAFAYHSAVEGENYPAGTCAALVTPPLVLETGYSHELRYWARFNIEVDWDGVVVEVSTDDGGTWQDLPPSVGYPGDFSQTGNPPINACGFDSSHGGFNGPAGNADLSPWMEYTSELSAFTGDTVLIRWRLSTDPGSEFEGFYLDDITVTNVRGPGQCANPNGSVSLDSATYACTDSATVQVADADLVGTGTVDVTASATSGDSIGLTLTENPAGSGRLIGPLVLGGGGLSVVHDDVVTVTYVDASDGLGGTDVPKTATATIDCVGPVVSDLVVSDIDATTAIVSWSTDEPADSTAQAEPGTIVASSTDRTTSHAVLLEGLSPCQVYTVSVSSEDAAGNSGAAGPTAPFVTLDQTLLIDDDVESGAGGWTVDTDQSPGDGTDWSIVVDALAPSPAHTWHSSDDGSTKDDRLVAGPFVIGSGTTVLEFAHHFNFESNWDGGVLEVALDATGSQWYDVTDPAIGGVFLTGSYNGQIRTTPSSPISGRAAWSSESAGVEQVAVDLSALGGEATVWIRFRLGCDGSASRDGWWIDDIRLETTETCACAGPTFAGVDSAAAVSGEAKALVSWTAADDACATGSIEYLVYAGDGAAAVDWNVPVAITDQLSTQVAGLTPGNQYWFGVRARDGLGHVDTNTATAGPVTAEGSNPAGDSNCSGDLSSDDLVGTTLYLFGGTAGGCDEEDADGSGSTDAADLAAVVRMLFDAL